MKLYQVCLLIGGALLFKVVVLLWILWLLVMALIGMSIASDPGA